MVVRHAVCSTSMGRGVRAQNDRHRLRSGRIESDCFTDRTLVVGTLCTDDITFLCNGDHAEELVNKMDQWSELKVPAVIGDDDGDDNEVTDVESHRRRP